ncbi:MAG: YidC/Oxa1 family insertase periplasmic-domain containing protein [Verrucomicrobiota bacterium]|jgi:YidC/Oxa1 family membrane protein insertase
MDRKGIVILVLAFGLLLGLQPLARWLFPSSQRPVATGTNAPAVAGSTNTASTSPTPPSLQGVQPLPAAAQSKPAGPESTLALTNGSARWVFTSQGGGIKRVELPGHASLTGRHAKGRSNGPVILNHDAMTPVLGWIGAAAVEGDASYSLQPIARGVRAEKSVGNGLFLVREYRLTTNDHLLHAVVRIENRTAGVLALPDIEWSTGAATPMNRLDKGEMLAVDYFNGSKAVQTLGWVSTPGLFCMMSNPREEYRQAEEPVVWASVQNQFFTLITLPDRPAKSFAARRIALPTPAPADLAADPEQVRSPAAVATHVQFGASNLEPGKTLEHRFTIYAGPKEYFVLSRLQPAFDQTLGYGFFGFFAKPLLLGMNFLHSVLRVPYGWCIVVITLLIKAAFWPLTAVSTRSMKRMAELGPQLQAIRDKYKDDPRKLNEKTMQFMRQSGYNPVSGCLPVVVQIPVFFGFFTMLRSAIELRGASFFWCPDLSAADTLFVIPGLGFIPLLGVPGLGLPLNLMPLFYVGTALWQTHLTPPSPQMDPVQQRLMRWMPLMFLALFYNYSAGLTLYWTVQNLLSILQTKLTKSNVPATSTPAAPRQGRRH